MVVKKKGKITVADGHPEKEPLVFSRSLDVRLTNQNELELQLIRKSIGALNDSTAVRFAIGVAASLRSVWLGQGEKPAVHQVADLDALKDYLAVRPGELVFLRSDIHSDPQDYGQRIRLWVGDIAFDSEGLMGDPQVDDLMEVLRGRTVIQVKGNRKGVRDILG